MKREIEKRKNDPQRLRAGLEIIKRELMRYPALMALNGCVRIIHQIQALLDGAVIREIHEEVRELEELRKGAQAPSIRYERPEGGYPDPHAQANYWPSANAGTEPLPPLPKASQDHDPEEEK